MYTIKRCFELEDENKLPHPKNGSKAPLFRFYYEK